ncbi:MAG: hypothetical protein KGL12_13955 [Rhodospirillales bacterium]|nr:hypothetical protein [Rhodospirillales bacterium]
MSSSTSSSERAAWRRFFRAFVGAAVIAGALVYGFLVLVDPFDTLPLSPPATRWPVATDARFSFPALARSARFDSAIFGTSTSRLLRPHALDPILHARFANLAMNDSTAWEQAQLMRVFLRAHPAPNVLMVGIDVRWCGTGGEWHRQVARPFPDWMYGRNRWAGYAHLFNLYAIQEAGQQFGILLGIKKPVYGRNGYTSFVPPDSEYDPARVAMHLRAAGPEYLPGTRTGPPASWRYPALEALARRLAHLPATSRVVLFFVPYNHVIQVNPPMPGADAWTECKRRVAALARRPGGLAVDFMIPSPITENDNHYWDALHYRIGVAARIAVDLGRAEKGETSPDYRILQRGPG